MDVIDACIDAWNAADPAERRAPAERVWTGDDRCADPLGVAEGRDAA